MGFVEQMLDPEASDIDRILYKQQWEGIFRSADRNYDGFMDFTEYVNERILQLQPEKSLDEWFDEIAGINGPNEDGSKKESFTREELAAWVDMDTLDIKDEDYITAYKMYADLSFTLADGPSYNEEDET
jgi:hypothetical protein